MVIVFPEKFGPLTALILGLSLFRFGKTKYAKMESGHQSGLGGVNQRGITGIHFGVLMYRVILV